MLRDDDALSELTNFGVTSKGLQRLLGAPLGAQDFGSEHAVKIIKELLKGLENLHFIDKAQLEFFILKFILKHCDATKATHLTRRIE